MLNKKAFTLVEIIVSITIFTFIVLGATLMLNGTLGIFNNVNTVQKYESIGSSITNYIHSKVKIADQVAIADYVSPANFAASLDQFNKVSLDSNGLIAFTKGSATTSFPVFSRSFFQNIHLQLSFAPNIKYIVQNGKKVSTWSKDSIQLTVELVSNLDSTVVYTKSSVIDLENAKLEFLTPFSTPALPNGMDLQDPMPQAGNTVCFVPSI